MRVVITIECDNAAFDGSPSYEVARLLKELATRLQDRGLVDTPVMDVNGNKVGKLVVED